MWTLDAYAWALYANAKFQDADAAVQKAIAVGIQSAQIFDHAGHIAQKLNHSADATKYFKLSVQSNPASEYAADALKSAGLAAAADDRETEGFSDRTCAGVAADRCLASSLRPLPISRITMQRSARCWNDGCCSGLCAGSGGSAHASTDWHRPPHPQRAGHCGSQSE